MHLAYLKLTYVRWLFSTLFFKINDEHFICSLSSKKKKERQSKNIAETLVFSSRTHFVRIPLTLMQLNHPSKILETSLIPTMRCSFELPQTTILINSIMTLKVDATLCGFFRLRGLPHIVANACVRINSERTQVQLSFSWDAFHTAKGLGENHRLQGVQ